MSSGHLEEKIISFWKRRKLEFELHCNMKLKKFAFPFETKKKDFLKKYLCFNIIPKKDFSLPLYIISNSKLN
jgi:hypothetical protein